MDKIVESVIRDTAEASNAGVLHFGEVVTRLVSAGVESYQVDYRTHRTTYYLPDGGTLSLQTPDDEGDIAQQFSSEAIKSAIRDAQRGLLMYPEFKQRSKRGGCVAYTVWLSGRHVVYYGRNGETHIEKFPD